MKRIGYYEPASLTEAANLLARGAGTTFILAGGTDLLVRLRRKIGNIQTIINIKKIPSLSDIKVTNGHLSIGCLATLSQIQSSELVRKYFPILPKVINQMATQQIRNIATMVGNICNASPAADTALPLLCLDACVEIFNTSETRHIPISNFFTGPGKTALHPHEIVTSILIPIRMSTFKISFHRLGIRRGLDIAIASACVSASPDLKEFRIALGSVAPTPLRAFNAEKSSSRKEEVAASECSPIDDLRASRWYRKEMVKVLTRRCIDEISIQTQ